MNNRSEKTAAGRHEFREAPRRNLFWVLLVLFLALGTDYGWRLADLKQQHVLLKQFQTQQTHNFGNIPRMQEMISKMQSLSFELLQMAPTNASVEQIVKEFGIQWTPPSSAVPTPAVVSTNQNAQTNK